MEHNYFNIQECLLEGSNLIEASAGTGKTYSIASLFIKALLEKRVRSVKNILVLTFTKAATAEIKLRIYENLLKSKRILEERDNNVKKSLLDEEPVIKDILAPYLNEPDSAVKILSKSLKSFDENGIYTIHGFCNLILNEYAFSSGSFFDKNMVTDQSLLVFETVVDYWRKYAFFAPKCVMKKLENIEFSQLIGLYKIKESNPHIDIKESEKDINEIARSVNNAYSNAVRIHDELAGELKKTDKKDLISLIPFEKLNGQVYKKPKTEERAEHFYDFILTEQPLYSKNADDGSNFLYFTSAKMESALKKNKEIDNMPPIFEITDKFYNAYTKYLDLINDWIAEFKRSMINFVHKRLNEYKRKHGILYFNDQLTVLHDALSDAKGHLTEKIAEDYPVVFVDEFQDTDPLQYEIIRKIFVNKSTVFFIGDPKQSIYSFRGADIYSYIKAKENVDNRYTMKTNFRSESAIVEGVNCIFNSRFRPEKPFAIESIEYSPVSSDNKGDSKLIVEGEKYKPLKVWAFETLNENFITRDNYNEFIASETAQEIARLLRLSGERKAYIQKGNKKENLKPADFAILCRGNAEAVVVKKYLDQLDIANIISSSKSIFNSTEAYEIHLFLKTLAEPGNLNLIKNLLIADIMDFSTLQIRNMEESEGFGEYSIKLREYRELLDSKGIMHCINEFLRNEDIMSNLIHKPYGKRKITNINHLAEILHKKESEGALQLHELLNWLNNQRSGNNLKEDEYELRMETDEEAVNILTIHKSKGLQFPVVFAPFLLSGSLMSRFFHPFIYHDDNMDMQLQLDKDEEIQRKYALENLSENLRLAYVALTRAKYRCYTAMAKVTDSHTSAFAYLFSGEDIFSKEWKKVYKEMSSVQSFLESALDADAFNFIDIQPLIQQSDETKMDFVASDLSENAEGKFNRLKLCEFQGRVPKRWKISSFSSLLRNLNPHETFATFMDDEVFDASEMSAEETKKDYSMFSLPRGVNTGNAMHDILEHTDLNTVRDSDLKENVHRNLNVYNIDTYYEDSVFENISSLRRKELGKTKDFKLKNIPFKSTLREMEFYFPSRNIVFAEIVENFKSNAAEGKTERAISESLGKGVINSGRLHGFMKGYIDFIFRYKNKYYIVDWKTNYLGDNHKDYDYDSLLQAVLKSQYFLQYHIYTTALVLYLNESISDFDYEKHFGGVYYIFLRGLESDEKSRKGVFFHKPSQKVVAGLINTFQIEPVFPNGGNVENS